MSFALMRLVVALEAARDSRIVESVRLSIARARGALREVTEEIDEMERIINEREEAQG